MVDKLHALPEHRIHQHVGRLDAEAMRQVDRELTMMPDLDR